MIYIKLNGGLGNQMFQFATAFSLANTVKTQVSFDIQALNIKSSKITPREYLLNHFNLPYENFSITRSYKNKYIERGGGFDKKVLSLKNEAYLEGYFQSEKYFFPFYNDLVKIFTPINLNLLSPKIIEQITNTQSVAVHIRRGDYLTNPTAFSTHGVLDLNYYRESISFLNKKINAPFNFIFSDDPDWAEHNLKIPNSVIMKPNKSNPEIDLYLMSKAKHFIIANSSFSWWGAWLSQNKSKIVITPKKWFVKIPSPDLVPDSWLKI